MWIKGESVEYLRILLAAKVSLINPVRIIWESIWLKSLRFWHLGKWVSRIERFMVGFRVSFSYKVNFFMVDEKGFTLIKFIGRNRKGSLHAQQSLPTTLTVNSKLLSFNQIFKKNKCTKKYTLLSVPLL